MSINDSSTANSPLIGMIQLSHGEGMALPAYESEGAAGMDLRAAVKDDQPVVIGPGERALLPTGLIMEIPHGFEGQIRPRSGLAARAGITCLNTPGTIDSDYRGEVRVLLVNLGQESFSVTRGLRMAQLVVAPVIQARVELRSEAGETARGAGGFGSTGTG